MEQYMTVKEVAVKVQLSEQTIRRHVMNRQIPFYKVIGAVRFKPCEIEKWVEEREAGKTGEKKDNNESGLFNEAGKNV